jgi:hypothetical protein
MARGGEERSLEMLSDVAKPLELRQQRPSARRLDNLINDTGGDFQ